MIETPSVVRAKCAGGCGNLVNTTMIEVSPGLRVKVNAECPSCLRRKAEQAALSKVRTIR